VKRVVILGPGGAGKSTLARRLGAMLDLPVVELDRHFWSPDLEAMPKERWRAVQVDLVGSPEWIMDGDLGPYDVVEVRLKTADTVVVLDVARWRCLWRSVRRSRQRLDFWRWVWTWRNKNRPQLLAAISAHANHARIEVFRTPASVDRWLNQLASRQTPAKPAGPS
jgi:adenylate kinase family enzyme